MNQQQQQPVDPVEDTKEMLNWLMLLVMSYSTAMEVFLHRNMGHRYLGFQAVAVLLLVPLHTLFMETRDPSLTAWFLLFFVLFCFAQRCNVWSRRSRGEYEHSHYNGYPWLRGERSNVSEITFKTWVEPVIVVGGGLLLCGLDRAFGSFIVTCGASMCIKGLVSLRNDSLSCRRCKQNQRRRSRLTDPASAIFGCSSLSAISPKSQKQLDQMFGPPDSA